MNRDSHLSSCVAQSLITAASTGVNGEVTVDFSDAVANHDQIDGMPRPVK